MKIKDPTFFWCFFYPQVLALISPLIYIYICIYILMIEHMFIGGTLGKLMLDYRSKGGGILIQGRILGFI